MKILVTGGAGFVGSHLADRLILEGHRVIVVDQKSKSERKFDNKKAKYYVVKIGEEQLADIFDKEKPEIVCHLAAQISVVESVKDPEFDAQTNIVDALHLLELAKKSGVKKFIFASSGGAIYGEQPEIPTPEIISVRPLSPYGIAKQSFENYLFAVKGFSSASLRFSNIYGPRQLPDGEAGVISIFLEKLFKGETATIFGDGSATRDYVFVMDVVEVILKTLNSEFHGTVNIGTGTETSVLELWRELSKIHAQGSSFKHAKARAGEISRSCLSTKHAKDVLGWTYKTKLADGLQKTYTWFKENKIAC